MDALDKIDQRIVTELHQDSSRNITELAKHLRLPRTTVKHRIGRLEKAGVIKGYKAMLDWEKLGFPLCNFFHIQTSHVTGKSYEELAEYLKSVPGVEEVFTTAGRWDIIAKVRMKRMADITKLIYDEEKGLLRSPVQFRSESMLVIKTYKEE